MVALYLPLDLVLEVLLLCKRSDDAVATALLLVLLLVVFPQRQIHSLKLHPTSMALPIVDLDPLECCRMRLVQDKVVLDFVELYRAGRFVDGLVVDVVPVHVGRLQQLVNDEGVTFEVVSSSELVQSQNLLLRVALLCLQLLLVRLLDLLSDPKDFQL